MNSASSVNTLVAVVTLTHIDEQNDIDSFITLNRHGGVDHFIYFYKSKLDNKLLKYKNFMTFVDEDLLTSGRSGSVKKRIDRNLNIAKMLLVENKFQGWLVSLNPHEIVNLDKSKLHSASSALEFELSQCTLQGSLLIKNNVGASNFLELVNSKSFSNLEKLLLRFENLLYRKRIKFIARPCLFPTETWTSTTIDDVIFEKSSIEAISTYWESYNSFQGYLEIKSKKDTKIIRLLKRVVSTIIKQNRYIDIFLGSLFRFLNQLVERSAVRKKLELGIYNNKKLPSEDTPRTINSLSIDISNLKISEKNALNIYFWRKTRYPNLGDELAKLIIERRLNVKVNRTGINNADCIIVGSILERAFKGATSGLSVFGCGFMDTPKELLTDLNLNIVSVRGYLTKSILEKYDYSCDYIGDIGLVVDELLDTSDLVKKHQVTLIPHHNHFDTYKSIIKKLNLPYNLIDLRTYNLDFVLMEIACSELVISQSLHGLVMADSLAIPNVWLKKERLHRGDDFKFKDYFSSIDRPDGLYVTERSGPRFS
ncbi:hypothetical protein BCT86_14445, partial [Vibrio breoganii]|uniref:polysaccharide pyruvyl transferase family protein n=1 Tax=Vibrio breoganii TaxID=553239 RepID=UPI000CC9E12C